MAAAIIYLSAIDDARRLLAPTQKQVASALRTDVRRLTQGWSGNGIPPPVFVDRLKGREDLRRDRFATRSAGRPQGN
jgi:hypothetical protein